MLLGIRKCETASRAQEILARFAAPTMERVAKVRGRPAKVYVANGGARHLVWIDEADGSITIEEHDARCNC